MEDSIAQTMKLLNHRTRLLLSAGILALAYFVTGKLAASVLGLVKAEASPVWPPAGIALAAMLLQGRRMWPFIALGSVLLNSTAGAGVPLAVIVTSAFSVTVQALAGEAVLSRSGFSTKLDRLRDVVGLVAGAVIGSTLVGSTLGNLGTCIFGWDQWSNFSRNWWTTWLGDGMGILIVTPVLLTLNHAFKSFHVSKKDRSIASFLAFFNWANYRLLITNYLSKFQDNKNRYNLGNSLLNYSEIALWLTLLLSVSSLVFCSKTQAASALYPLEYLPFPLIVWAALRFRQPGAIFAYSIVSYIAILGAVQGGGPFLVRSENLQQAVLFLQAFTGTIALVALMLAAAVAEREQALEFVRRTAALLRDRSRQFS